MRDSAGEGRRAGQDVANMPTSSAPNMALPLPATGGSLSSTPATDDGNSTCIVLSERGILGKKARSLFAPREPYNDPESAATAPNTMRTVVIAVAVAAGVFAAVGKWQA